MRGHDIAYTWFWERLQEHRDRVAIIDAQARTVITYRQLEDLSRAGANQLKGTRKRLACLAIRNDIAGILCYLSLLRSRHAIYLCGSQVAITLNSDFIDRYRPDLILGRPREHPAVIGLGGQRNDDPVGYRGVSEFLGHGVLERQNENPTENIYPELALLLPTSGSTGSSKTVQISYENLAANAWQIAGALEVEPTERIVLSLPLHYAYGLSVLHSALSVGASLVIGKRTILEPGFWEICRTTEVTTLPTVPAMLKSMQSIGMHKVHLSSLRKITVSGAAIDNTTRSWLFSQILPRQVQVYSMYGMTEATARIAVLPADEFPTRSASVGRVVCHGNLQILPSGEIVYRGPNVMLGYANDRSDLERGDLMGGVLNTGDLGSLDEASTLYLTGRLTRICKLLGARIDLTDMERQLADLGEVAVVSDDEVIRIFHTNEDESEVDALATQLAERWRIPRAALILKRVSTIPHTDSGKIRYADLWRL